MDLKEHPIWNFFDLFSKLGVNDGFERTSYLELLEKLY